MKDRRKRMDNNDMLLVYLAIWCSLYVCMDANMDGSRDAINIMAKQSFSIVRRDSASGHLYVGDGNLVRVYDTGFKEAESYYLGPPSVNQYDDKCNDKNAIDNKYCENKITNTITLLELFYKGGDLHLFVCTGQSNGTCYIINTVSNGSDVTKMLLTLHGDAKYAVTHDVNATSFLMNNTGDSKDDDIYICMAKDIKPNTIYHKRQSIVVLNVSLSDRSVSVLSPKQLSTRSTYAKRVILGFGFESAAYFIMKYSSRRTERALLLKLTLENDKIHYIETSIRCTGNNSNEQFVSASVFKDKLILFSHANSSLGVCFAPMDKVEDHFRMSMEDCRIRRKGSGLEWIRQRFYNVCADTTDMFRSVSVLELKASPWKLRLPSSPGHILVTSKLGSIVAYYAPYTSDNTRQIIKLKLGSNSDSLQWFEDVSVGLILDMWTNASTLYVVGSRKIVTLDTARCKYPLLSSCNHDLDCVWCGEPAGACMKRDACAKPANVDKLAQFGFDLIEPTHGFSCGGSVMRINGRNLDLTRNINVTIGGRKCDVMRDLSTSKTIEVRVPSQSDDVKVVKASVVFPNGTAIYSNFTFSKCPQIAESKTGNKMKLMKSGGNKIELFVDNIDNIPDTHFHLIEVAFVYQDKVVATAPLDYVDFSKIRKFAFIAPPLIDYVGKRLKVALAAPTYYLMDRGATPTVLYGNVSNLDVVVEEDPVILGIHVGNEITIIQNFRVNDSSSEIVFAGKNLDKIPEKDVAIDISPVGPCTRIRIDRPRNRLECDLPWPEDMFVRSHIYDIVIKIGRNLIYYPGQVKYTKDQKPPPTRRTDATRPAPTTTKVVESTEDTPILQTVIPVTVAIVVLFVVCVLCLCYRFRKNNNSRDTNDREYPSIVSVSYRSNHGVIINDGRPSFNTASAENSSTDAFIADNFDESAQLIIGSMEDEGLLLRKRDLNIDKLIGRGNFGSVYKGHLCQKNERTEIAVKTLQREKPENMDITQFLKEAYVMKNFQHLNVMTLVGVCLDAGDMPLVVLPYMKHGDLLTYLQEERHIPTVKDLVCFGLDIALGMEYLASLKFVHRDLAARNCMLDVNFRVKVADFGLSRDVYETTYYSTQSKGIKLPVKWMAIESLSSGVFNERTDVWSFGVTLWELMTRGVRPYAAVDNWDMEAYLKSERRLPQPIYCPANLYKLMRKCWSQEPEDRPTFTTIKVWISELLNRVHHTLGDMESATNIENTYVNLGKGNECLYENLANF